MTKHWMQTGRPVVLRGQHPLAGRTGVITRAPAKQELGGQTDWWVQITLDDTGEVIHAVPPEVGKIAGRTRHETLDRALDALFAD